jgi:c-di-GMP-binding flagellar brake protein YcgR
MNNRRQYYRHTMPPARGITVTLRSSDGKSCCTGAMADLSIGGVCARFEDSPAAKSWLATFNLGLEGPTLTIPVEQVHGGDERPGKPGCCGFRFLPRPNPRILEEQERMIWSFLLDEQRGQRRQAREAKRATG